jgi:hypothetical protein
MDASPPDNASDEISPIPVEDTAAVDLSQVSVNVLLQRTETANQLLRTDEINIATEIVNVQETTKEGGKQSKKGGKKSSKKDDKKSSNEDGEKTSKEDGDEDVSQRVSKHLSRIYTGGLDGCRENVYIPCLNQCLLQQGRYFTRTLDGELAVSFMHWISMRLDLSKLRQQGNLSTLTGEERAASDLIMQQQRDDIHSIFKGWSFVMKEGVTSISNECKKLHSSGRYFWHLLMTLSAMLNDFCILCTCDFTSQDEKKGWKHCMRVMFDILKSCDKCTAQISKIMAVDAFGGKRVAIAKEVIKQVRDKSLLGVYNLSMKPVKKEISKLHGMIRDLIKSTKRCKGPEKSAGNEKDLDKLCSVIQRFVGAGIVGSTGTLKKLGHHLLHGAVLGFSEHVHVLLHQATNGNRSTLLYNKVSDPEWDEDEETSIEPENTHKLRPSATVLSTSINCDRINQLRRLEANAHLERIRRIQNILTAMQNEWTKGVEKDAKACKGSTELLELAEARALVVKMYRQVVGRRMDVVEKTCKTEIEAIEAKAVKMDTDEFQAEASEEVFIASVDDNSLKSANFHFRYLADKDLLAFQTKFIDKNHQDYFMPPLDFFTKTSKNSVGEDVDGNMVGPFYKTHTPFAENEDDNIHMMDINRSSVPIHPQCKNAAYVLRRIVPVVKGLMKECNVTDDFSSIILASHGDISLINSLIYRLEELKKGLPKNDNPVQDPLAKMFPVSQLGKGAKKKKAKDEAASVAAPETVENENGEKAKDEAASVAAPEPAQKENGETAKDEAASVAAPEPAGKENGEKAKKKKAKKGKAKDEAASVAAPETVEKENGEKAKDEAAADVPVEKTSKILKGWSDKFNFRDLELELSVKISSMNDDFSQFVGFVRGILLKYNGKILKQKGLSNVNAAISILEDLQTLKKLVALNSIEKYNPFKQALMLDGTLNFPYRDFVDKQYQLYFDMAKKGRLSNGVMNSTIIHPIMISSRNSIGGSGDSRKAFDMFDEHIRVCRDDINMGTAIRGAAGFLALNLPDMHTSDVYRPWKYFSKIEDSLQKRRGVAINKNQYETDAFLREVNLNRDVNIPTASVGQVGVEVTKIAVRGGSKNLQNTVKSNVQHNTSHILDASVHRGPRVQIATSLRKRAGCALRAVECTLNSTKGLYNAKTFLQNLHQQLSDSSDGADLDSFQQQGSVMNTLSDLSDHCGNAEADRIAFNVEDCRAAECYDSTGHSDNKMQADKNFYIQRVLHIYNLLDSPGAFETLEEKYYHLAMLEDYHRNISISVCDVMCMVVDVAKSLEFLLDRFGCDEWPGEGPGHVYKKSGDRPSVETPVQVDGHGDAEEMKQLFANDLSVKNLKVRNPFLKRIIEVRGSERPLNMQYNTESYQKDVFVIRDVLRKVMAVGNESPKKDAESNVSCDDLPCYDDLPC